MGQFFGPAIQWAISPLTERERILQRYIDSRPPEDQDAEAQICFGAKSTFGFAAGSGFRTAPTVTITYPPVTGDNPDPDPEAPDEVYLDFDEVSRVESEVRVENPDDSEQYVIVANVDEIVFSGPDLRPAELVGNEGRQQKIFYRYTLHTPTE